MSEPKIRLGQISPSSTGTDQLSGNVALAGNLTFSGTGLRILGDMSNATQASRLLFQTSTANGTTNIGAIPNGTGTTAQLLLANSSDPANASRARFNVGPSEAQINIDLLGTGTYLPMTFYTGGSERMRLDTSGNVGIGGTASAAAKLNVRGTLPQSGGFAFGIYNDGVISSATTGNARIFYSLPSTQAASFTCGGLAHYQAAQGTFGASSTVTSQFGFLADGSLTGATNNYGFYSDIASGSNRWNFYANGTANNYFAGAVGIGAFAGGAIGDEKLRVRGTDADSFVVTWEDSTGNRLGGLYANATVVGVGSVSSVPLIFQTNQVERMRIDSSGNLTFSGTAQRITGDMSNATIANRLAFQTSTTNSVTVVTAIPNGTSNIAAFSAESDSAATNSSTIQIAIRPTTGDAAVIAGIRGTGTYLPMTFFTNNAERMRLTTSGDVGVGGVPNGGFITGNKMEIFSAALGTTAGNTSSPLMLTATDGNTTTLQTFNYRVSNGSSHNTSEYRTQRIVDVSRQGYVGWGSDYLAFGTNNTQRMLINSSGNVGIGTSSPAFASGDGLEVQRAADATVRVERTGATASAGEFVASSGLVKIGATSGSPFTFITDNTERMRIDSSGNVGIGTTVPGTKLEVYVSGGGPIIRAASDATGGGAGNGFHIGLDGSAGAYLSQNENAPLYFYTNATEKMQIAASGLVGIGVNPSTILHVNASASVSARIRISTSDATGYSGIEFYTTAGAYSGFIGRSGSNNDISFWTSGNGSIPRVVLQDGGELITGGVTDNGAYNLQCNGTGVWGAGAYVNGSDERIKKNILPLGSTLDVVMAINPIQYQYKEENSADNSVQPGFTAQDLQLAMVGKDYLEGIVREGPEYLNVAYQNMIPILTKAIQEQQTLIQALTARVAELENK